MENTIQAQQKVSHPALMMVSLLLGAFVGMFSETALNIALPQLMIVFHTNTSTIQWLVTGYMLVIGIVLPLASLISKWFTTRQVIIFALIDFIVGALISATAQNFTFLLAGRMIQGIATGLILPLMFAIVMQIFPAPKIGTAMGFCALVIMFAPAIGPTITGFVLAELSWRWIFWLFIPFLLIGLLFAFYSLENIGEVTKPHVDVLSIIESIFGCSGLVISASLASSMRWFSFPVIFPLLIGFIALGFYVHRQLHLKVPILNLRIFQIPTFTIGTLLVMLDFAIILSTMYLLPMFYQRGLLISVALTGIVMLPGGLVNAITSAFAGRIYDNVGVKLPAILGFTIALIGTLMLAFTTPHSSIVYVMLAHIVLMIGCPLALSPSQTSALSSLSGKESGDGSTIMNTMQQMIGALSTALTTNFLAWGSSAQVGSSALRFTNGFHYGIYFAILLIIIALLLSLRLQKES
ncbi:DHA2 family efflux MFS transporter permease subunit [Lactobacillaceae bacterium 24-114]